MERERQVAREILLRRYLRGEEIAPTSRNQLREALGITNAEAAHLGLSDFSDARTCARTPPPSRRQWLRSTATAASATSKP